MEHSGNIPIFNILETLFGNIPWDFIGNCFRIFREYVIGIYLPGKWGMRKAPTGFISPINN